MEIHIHPVVFGAQTSVHKSAVEDNAQTITASCIDLESDLLCRSAYTSLRCVPSPSFIVAKNFGDKSRRLSCETVLRNSGDGERDYSKCAGPQGCCCENRRYYMAFILVYFLRRKLQGAC